jgi:hypothetical protein
MAAKATPRNKRASSVPVIASEAKQELLAMTGGRLSSNRFSCYWASPKLRDFQRAVLTSADMSVRKVREGETTNDLFAFLTTEPNAVVAPAADPPAVLHLFFTL